VITPEPLWKVADVARFLSMSDSWVYKEAEAGRLPCFRLGAALRFRPEAIRRWLEQTSAPSNVARLRP
jgi:excisionase family DNA binding protein